MANKLYTIESKQSDLGSENLDVYIDLAADSSPDFDAYLPRKTIDDFVQSSERFLSACQLSGYTVDENNNRVIVILQDAGTGWDWLMRSDNNGAYKQLSGEINNKDKPNYLISSFMPDTAISAANLVFQYLSVDDGNAFTQQTVDMLSSAITAAAGAFVKDMEAEACPWNYIISKLVNVNAVKNSIKQIFTWIPGERIINPEFGSNLRKYLYEPITEENQERIVAEIRQCALRWEPRIIVDRVVKATTTDDVENNTVKLDIYYRIKGLNDKQFMYQYEYSRPKYSYM